MFSTISVTHSFEVTTEAKVTAIVCIGDTPLLERYHIYGVADVEPLSDLQGRGRPRDMLRRLHALNLIFPAFGSAAVCGAGFGGGAQGSSGATGISIPGNATLSGRNLPVSSALHS